MKKLAIDYRKITEAFPQDLKKALKRKNIVKLLKGYSMVFLSVSLLVFVLYAVVMFFNYLSARSKWLKARDNFAYWQEVAEKQKKSPDAYYQASIYAAELRDNTSAVGFLNKAIELDPGFEKAKELRAILGTR